jgi:TonB family protein
MSSPRPGLPALLPLLFALAAAAPCGCAHLEVGPPPPLHVRSPAPSEEGPCDPVEYTAFAKHAGDVALNVALDDSGHATHVEAVHAHELSPQQIDRAVDIVRHAFRCRHRLAANAPRLYFNYLFRYVANLDVAPSIDNAACARAARYPTNAERDGMAASVLVGLTLDEGGRIDSAWVDRPDGDGFAASAIDALTRRCHFTPARWSGRATPFYLVYRFNFEQPPRS